MKHILLLLLLISFPSIAHANYRVTGTVNLTSYTDTDGKTENDIYAAGQNTFFRLNYLYDNKGKLLNSPTIQGVRSKCKPTSGGKILVCDMQYRQDVEGITCDVNIRILSAKVYGPTKKAAVNIRLVGSCANGYGVDATYEGIITKRKA